MIRITIGEEKERQNSFLRADLTGGEVITSFGESFHRFSLLQWTTFDHKRLHRMSNDRFSWMEVKILLVESNGSRQCQRRLIGHLMERCQMCINIGVEGKARA